LVEVNISLNDQNINIFTGIGWKFRLLVSWKSDCQYLLFYFMNLSQLIQI
jgi:hypothetical protein